MKEPASIRSYAETCWSSRVHVIRGLGKDTAFKALCLEDKAGPQGRESRDKFDDK